MKIRRGFVTNSSSSSFIIGKYNTIDDVYNTMRDSYIELKKKFDNMIEYCISRKDKHYPQPNNSNKDFYTIKFEDNYPYEKQKAINDELKRLFGLSSWDYFRKDEIEKIISCKTYNDYDKAFKDRKPFEVVVFDNIKEYYIREEILDWYSDNEYLESYYLGTKEELEKLFHKKVIVTSECGLIPDFVVNKLTNLSIACCNHMG